MKADVPEPTWHRFLEAAEQFWARVRGSATHGEDLIIVEAFSEHFRTLLRNLSVANALRAHVPARLLVVGGADSLWTATVWPEVDLAKTKEMVSAFGGEFLDIVEVADMHRRFPHRRHQMRVFGKPVTIQPNGGKDDVEIAAVLRSSWARLQRRIPFEFSSAGIEAARRDPLFVEREQYVRSLATIWRTLIHNLAPRALVTSHVDYDQWVLGAVPALRSDCPVLLVHSTGGLRVNAVFPEAVSRHASRAEGTVYPRSSCIGSHAALGPTFRSVLTDELGQLFRDIVARAGEFAVDRGEEVVRRNASNLGRPAWWRSGAHATLNVHGAAQRAKLRRLYAAQLGLDPSRPTVGVFNHAVTDALNTNVEAFPSLDRWFSATAELASERTDVQWLMLDHPSQAQYDSSGFFESLARSIGPRANMVWRRSDQLTKNCIWSLADLALTVRGSIGHEMPAYGIGALQAGWSDSSDCGLSRVATTTHAYWDELESMLDRLRKHGGTATSDEHANAKMYQWFYRSATDVSSVFVPHWDHHHDRSTMDQATRNYNHVEADADPLFSAVAAMWDRRSPSLLRPGPWDIDPSTSSRRSVVIPRSGR